jgi:hypothetical protein
MLVRALCILSQPFRKLTASLELRIVTERLCSAFIHNARCGALAGTPDTLCAPPAVTFARAAAENETFFTLDSASSQIYEALSNYRQHYAQFRQGAPQGARGEVTAVSSLMTVEHISRLPVGQRAGQVKSAKTADQPRPKTQFHLHFGGGRLGLGLLSPAIANVSTVNCYIVLLYCYKVEL